MMKACLRMCAAARGSDAHPSRTGQRLLLGLCTALLLPPFAHAHVKWFVDFDLTRPPRAPLQVVGSPEFLLMLACVLPLMYAVFWIDQHVSAGAFWHRRKCGALVTRLSTLSERVALVAPDFLRLALSAFFFTLCLYGSFLITPELKTDATWARWLQGIIALLLLTRRSAWLGALCIPVLYGYAIYRYGFFHLLDYPIFLGIAGYLFLWSWYGVRTATLADGMLRAMTAITLLWASIEKWGYPEWSFGLLSARPALSFGFSPEFYMVAAGFVEFCTAYLLITGSAASRAAAVVLLFFFVSAIFPFGMIDAVGHSGIIVVLIVLTLGKPNPWVRVQASDISQPALVRKVFWFVCVLVLMGLAYSSLHRLAYDFPAVWGSICYGLRSS